MPDVTALDEVERQLVQQVKAVADRAREHERAAAEDPLKPRAVENRARYRRPADASTLREYTIHCTSRPSVASASGSAMMNAPQASIR